MSATKRSRIPAPKPLKRAIKKTIHSLKVSSYKFRSGLAGKSEGTYRLFSAGGGHGSSFLISALQKTGRQFAVRPDNALANDEGWIDKTLDDCPDPLAADKFRKATGFSMDVSSSINDNFLAYMDHLDRVNEFALLSRISRVGPFLTRNGISRAICLVRHPLHAYVSYIGHQHPEAAANLGDIESPPRVAWYAKQWNAMTRDYLDSGSKIMRYEMAPEDIKDVESPPLGKLLAGWRTSTRNHGVLSKQNEDYLRELVAETFDQVYDRWDI